jgi:hypothetical protein
MNANGNSPKASARLKRIRIVSRIVRVPMLAMCVYLVSVAIVQVVLQAQGLFQIFGGLAPTSFYEHPLAVVIGLINSPGIAIISAIWFWKLARLFSFYERGLIFDSGIVRCMKFLGWLCVARWMWGFILIFLRKYYLFPLSESTYGVHTTANIRELSHDIDIQFFMPPILGIDFGLLLAGILIILIAWIMDEGRKIQEEQELTV